MESPEDLDLGRVYDDRFKDLEYDERQRTWAEIAPFIFERFGRPDRVLDVASGLGEFIANVPATERWAVDLVDHGVTSVPGVTCRIASFLDADLPEDHFDLIFISNLLEHLASPDEVARFLSRAHTLMAPGGIIVILGPNFKYTTKVYFDCADHILALTDVSVTEHLHAAHFRVIEATARFLPFSFRSRLPASPLLVRNYLRIPLAWKILGKQFLVAGRKD